MKAAAENFLHGPRGDRVVVLPQRFVDWLYGEARIPELHRRHKGLDPVVDAVLVAISLAALERRGSEVGTVSAPRSELGSESGQSLSTKAAADQLHIGTRAVTKAITAGRLNATRDDTGRWRIKPCDLDAYRRAS